MRPAIYTRAPRGHRLVRIVRAFIRIYVCAMALGFAWLLHWAWQAGMATTP